MLQKAWTKIYRLISHMGISNDQELYLYLVLSITSIYACLMHLFLLGLFFVFENSVMTTVNAASVVWYAVCQYQVGVKKRYAFAGLAISFEVMFYVIATSIFIGFGNYTIFYLILILVMQLTVPYTTPKIRAIVVALLWLTLTSAMFLSQAISPHPLPGRAQTVLIAFNIQVSFFGLVIEQFFGNIVRLVSEQIKRRRMEELESQVYTDPLTGLFNRRYAEEFFLRVTKGQEDIGWCIALLDVDNFKLINDSYGHAVGDEVLKALSNIMKQTLRKTDILFRWGGEEFLLLLKGVDLETAYLVLEKLRQNITEVDILTKSGIVKITATIGVTQLNAKTPSASIEECDCKMYEGKRSGKDKVVV